MTDKAARLRERIDVVAAYRQTFTDDRGNLTESARLVFRDIAKFIGTGDARLVKDNDGRVDPVAHVHRDGGRAVFNKIEERLQEDLAALHAALRQAEQE